MLIASFCSEEAYSSKGTYSDLKSREDEGSRLCVRGGIRLILRDGFFILLILRPRLPTTSAPELPDFRPSLLSWSALKLPRLQATITDLINTKATWLKAKNTH